MRTRFQEVSLKGARRWTEDGKRRQETKKFWQTISPFNVGVDNLPKTHEQILDELRAERKLWESSHGK